MKILRCPYKSPPWAPPSSGWLSRPWCSRRCWEHSLVMSRSVLHWTGRLQFHSLFSKSGLKWFGGWDSLPLSLFAWSACICRSHLGSSNHFPPGPLHPLVPRGFLRIETKETNCKISPLFIVNWYFSELKTYWSFPVHSPWPYYLITLLIDIRYCAIIIYPPSNFMINT